MGRSKTISASSVMNPGPLSEPDTGTWKDFITLTKTGIVTSNLMTVFLGIWLAAKFNGLSLIDNVVPIILALVGATLVLAGATSLNNYIDRDIDKIMPRTKDRPSAAGRIPEKQVLFVGLALAFAGTALLLAIEVMAAVWGLIGLVFYIFFYSLWTKRTTTFNTAVGAVSGAVPPMIGWAAIDPGLHPVAWVLFIMLFLWQMPHFFAVGMKRCEDYRAAGIPMLPVVAGFAVTKRQMVIYTGALIPVSLFLYPLGPVYTAGALILGFGWLAYGLRGFKMKDDLKWAHGMFVFSLNYLTLMVILMIVVTL